jgi:PPOX class probable F420-dependent enzyme
MSEQIEGKARELLEGANFCHLATIARSGRAQINPVWVHTDDGGHIVLNSAEGRAWPENVRRNPQVTLCVPNQENPYEYVTVWGRVVDDTHEGADENINALSKKYLGEDEYPFRQPGEQRILFRVEPERVRVNSG